MEREDTFTARVSGLFEHSFSKRAVTEVPSYNFTFSPVVHPTLNDSEVTPEENVIVSHEGESTTPLCATPIGLAGGFGAVVSLNEAITVQAEVIELVVKILSDNVHPHVPVIVAVYPVFGFTVNVVVDP